MMKLFLGVLFSFVSTANLWGQEQNDTTIFKELEIGEVTITANRIRNKVNGYVVSLQGEEFVKGKNAEEVLAFLPRVEYRDDKLKIDGVAVSEIYVNGVRLADMNLLKNILGDQLKNVEVQYTPGVNQKSSTSGGVIRINLRQPNNGGHYGSLTARHNFAPTNWNANNSVGGMVYWGNKRLGIYTNGGLAANTYKDKYQESFGERPTNIASITQARLRQNGKNVYDNVGLSYKLNDWHSFTGNLYISRRLSDATSKMKELLSTTRDLNYLRANGNNTYADAIVQYAGQLDSLGTSLTITAEQIYSYINNENLFSDFQYGTNIVNRSNLSKIEMNFQKPIGKMLIMELGGSVDYTHFSYRDRTPIDRKYAGTKGDANINATTPLLFINFAGGYKRIKFMLGTNYQHNYIHYNDFLSGLVSKNHQWSFNPQANLEIILNLKHGISWQIGYQHRMGDIPYGDINASMVWENEHFYATGNPNLKAWTSNNFLTSFSFLQGKISIKGIYSKGHNFCMYETIEDPNNPGIYMTRPVNRPNNDITAGINLNINLSPIKIWRMNLSASCVWDRFDNTIGGVYYGGWGHHWSFNMSNSLSITETLQVALNGQYEPSSFAYGKQLYSIRQLDGSISKQLGKHWQASINGTITKIPRSWSEISSTAYRFHDTQREERYIQVRLTYRFDNGKSTRHRSINHHIIRTTGETRQK